MAKIVATRQRTQEKLAALGFVFQPSKTNFVFVTHPVWKAEKLFGALREKDIYVRYFRQPRIDNYLRITIGTDEEMDQLFGFLENYQEE